MSRTKNKITKDAIQLTRRAGEFSDTPNKIRPRVSLGVLLRVGV